MYIRLFSIAIDGQNASILLTELWPIRTRPFFARIFLYMLQYYGFTLTGALKLSHRISLIIKLHTSYCS